MPTTTFDLSLTLRTGRAADRVDKLGRSASRTGRAFDGTQRRVDRAGKATRQYGTAAGRASRNARSAASNTTRFGTAASRAGRSLGNVARRLFAVAAVLLTISAGMAQLRSSVNVFSEFESSMAAVQAVTSATTTDMAAMTAVSRELGETTRFSASEAAAGMEFLGRAGFQTSQIVGAMPSVLNLAAAAKLDLGRAADITSNIMSAFGVSASEASRISDALAASAANANTDVGQMGEAMKFVGPVASALGISMEDAAAAVGVLSNAGLQASVAGTGLRRVLSELASPGKKAIDTLDKLGVSMSDVDPQTRSLTQIIRRLSDANLGAADAFEIFGDRGAPAILALTSQAADLERLTDKVNNSAGAARNMADVMEDNLSGEARRLRSVIESVRIEVGEALSPAIRSSIVTFREWLDVNRDAFRAGAEFAVFLSTRAVSAVAAVSGEIRQMVRALGFGSGGASGALAATRAAAQVLGQRIDTLSGFVRKLNERVETNRATLVSALRVLDSFAHRLGTVGAAWRQLRGEISSSTQLIVNLLRALPGGQAYLRLLGDLATTTAHVVAEQREAAREQDLQRRIAASFAEEVAGLAAEQDRNAEAVARAKVETEKLAEENTKARLSYLEMVIGLRNHGRQLKLIEDAYGRSAEEAEFYAKAVELGIDPTRDLTSEVERAVRLIQNLETLSELRQQLDSTIAGALDEALAVADERRGEAMLALWEAESAKLAEEARAAAETVVAVTDKELSDMGADLGDKVGQDLRRRWTRTTQFLVTDWGSAVGKMVRSGELEWERLTDAMVDTFFDAVDRMVQRWLQTQFEDKAVNIGGGGGGSSFGSSAAWLPFAVAVGGYLFSQQRQAQRDSQRFGAGASTGGNINALTTSPIAPGTSQQVRELTDAVERAVRTTLDAMGALAGEIPQLGVQVRNDGREFVAEVGGIAVGAFETFEQALSAAVQAGFQQGQFDGLGENVRRALEQGASSLEEFQERLAAALELDLGSLTAFERQAFDLQRVWAATLRQTADFGASAVSQYGEMLRELEALAASASSEDEVRTVQQLYSQLEQQRQAEIEQIQRLIAEMQRTGAAGGGLGGALGGAGRQLDGMANSATLLGDVAAKASGDLGALGDATFQLGHLAGLSLEQLERRLRELQAVTIPSAPPPTPAGGGGGSTRESERRTLIETLEQIERSALSDVNRSLVELESRFQEMRQTAQETGVSLERVAEARMIELQALRQQLVTDPISEFLGDAFHNSEFENQAQSIRDRFEEIRQANEALLDQEDELFTARWKINLAEQRALEQLAEQVITGLGLPMEQAQARVDRWAESIDLLQRMLDDGVISAERFGEVMAQAMQMADAELLGLTAGILDQMGASQQAAEFRARLEEANFHLQVAQLNFLYQQYLELGLISDEVAENLAETLAFINNPDNWPDFSAPPPPPPPPPPPTASGPDIDSVRQRLEDQIEAWERLPLGDVTREALSLTDQLEEMRDAAREAGLSTAALDRAFRTAVSTFVDDVLGPFEDLNLSPLERELRDLEAHFEDIRAAFAEVGATAADWQRLADAQNAAFADFWQRATEPLRGLLDELRANDPRQTSEQAFTSAQQSFRDLAARARAGDLEALQQLEQAGRNLIAQGDAFLSGGVGSLALRDEIMQTLEDLTGEGLNPDDISDPVRDEVRAGNDILYDIRELLGGRGRPRADIAGRSGTRRPVGRPPAGSGLDFAEPARERSFEQRSAQIAERERLGGDLAMVARELASGRQDDEHGRAAIEALARELAAQARREEQERETDRNRGKNTTNAHLEQRGEVVGLLHRLVRQNEELMREQRLSREIAGGPG